MKQNKKYYGLRRSSNISKTLLEQNRYFIIDVYSNVILACANHIMIATLVLRALENANVYVKVIDTDYDYYTLQENENI